MFHAAEQLLGLAFPAVLLNQAARDVNPSTAWTTPLCTAQLILAENLNQTTGEASRRTEIKVLKIKWGTATTLQGKYLQPRSPELLGAMRSM